MQTEDILDIEEKPILDPRRPAKRALKKRIEWRLPAEGLNSQRISENEENNHQPLWEKRKLGERAARAAGGGP